MIYDHNGKAFSRAYGFAGELGELVGVDADNSHERVGAVASERIWTEEHQAMEECDGKGPNAEIPA